MYVFISVISDEDRYEKKRHSAILYQSYLNRSGPKHLGAKEIPEVNLTLKLYLSIITLYIPRGVDNEMPLYLSYIVDCVVLILSSINKKKLKFFLNLIF